MRLYRSEIIFLGYLMLLSAAALLTYLSVNDLGAILEVVDNPQVNSDLEGIRSYILSVCLILAVCVVAGVAGIYPTIRRDAREHGRLSEETQNLTKKTETFQQAALTDPLTGLQNRRYFDDALNQYLEEFAAIGHPLGMIVMDLDHFKKVNDTYGHDIGDDVLRGVTKCLLDYTRYHDVVARIGGEEFAILAPNLDARSLQRLAERICNAVSEITYQAENVSFRVTTSMGLALWDGAESASKFVKRADQNLYKAKTGGRNRAVA